MVFRNGGLVGCIDCASPRGFLLGFVGCCPNVGANKCGDEAYYCKFFIVFLQVLDDRSR